MPLEIAALATSVVGAFLVPLIKKGAEKIAETVTEKVSDAAGKHVTEVAETLWEKVKGAFRSNAEQATLEQFQKYPEQSQPLVEAVLKEKLQADPVLAEELTALVEKPIPGDGRTAVNIAAQTVGYVDAKGATISGGIVAGTIVGTPPPVPPPNR